MAIPDTLPEITHALVALRKKPGTQAQFKQYPQLLGRFNELLAQCADAETLKATLRADSGYFLPANYRQRVLETLLTLERTPPLLRAYAMQLELFGDVDALGEADLDVDERVAALYAEADALAQDQNHP